MSQSNIRLVIPLAAIFLLMLAAVPLARSQETVNNPDIVMNLEWRFGSWTDIWQIREFASKAVDSDVSYYIYLPPDYAKSNQRYPVVYWLHGAYGRPYSATPVVKRLDAAIREHGSPEMIIVSCFDPTGLSMWTNSEDGRLPMESILIDELIPHIDASFRTVSNRDGRAIEGFSMGGYGAAFLGAKYNDVFSSFSILAGALHTPESFRDRRSAIFKNVFSADLDYAQTRSPWQLIKDQAAQVRADSSVRIFVGADDGLLQWNTNYHETLLTLGIEHEWGVVPDSPHDLESVMQNWQGDFFAYYRQVFDTSK